MQKTSSKFRHIWNAYLQFALTSIVMTDNDKTDITSNK